MPDSVEMTADGDGDARRICAHDPCACPAEPGLRYCCDRCETAASREDRDTPVCDCEHSGCSG